MTVNQLITLLEVARVSAVGKIRCGTTDDDITFLIHHGLIEDSDIAAEWSLTDKGSAYVDAAKSIKLVAKWKVQP